MRILNRDGATLFEFDGPYVTSICTLVESAAESRALRRASLVGADLRYAKLSFADMHGACLRGAKLTHANLFRANLSGADLLGTNLCYADLGYANLGGADMRYADLRDANLTGADLRGADLRGADLRDANLSGATGIDPWRTAALRELLDRPDLLRAYKLVDSSWCGPWNGGITYAIGGEYAVNDAETDARVLCARGINLATLEWCRSEWRDGYHILVAEFNAADIAAIPYATDGQFRVRRCRIVGEVDPVTDARDGGDAT